MSDLQPRGIPHTVGGVERNFLFTLAAVDEIQAKYDLPISQVMAKLADDREVYDTIAVLATILINDEITLRNYGGEMHVYFYEKEYLEAFETRTLKVPDTVSFMDGVDPETGDPLDEEAKRTADEFRALLAGGKEMDPGFDADNVYVSFDDNEEMVLVQRFYAPWQ